jgi:hypothetical protein
MELGWKELSWLLGWTYSNLEHLIPCNSTVYDGIGIKSPIVSKIIKIKYLAIPCDTLEIHCDIHMISMDFNI